MSVEKITIYDPKKTKPVLAGHLVNRVFVKRVNSLKHLIRKFNGYAIQKTVIDALKGKCDYVVIIVDQTTRYTISFNDFLDRSKLWDAGHGQQLVIACNEMIANDTQEDYLV